MDQTIFNYTQNRELSWLKFNQRVLHEAQDPSVPLLERLKFVAIYTSNLDEFFMIRVGSLFDMCTWDQEQIDPRSGMTPRQQIDAILKVVAPLYKERDKTYAEIKKQLNPYGVCGLWYKELEPHEKKYTRKYFKEQILPILSPQIVDANHPFPHLLNKEIYVIANLQTEEKSMLGIVPVPQFVSDILYLPGNDIRFIRMEKVIMEYLDIVFEGYQVTNPNYICVTRNADIAPDDEAWEVNDDFRFLMKKTLNKRRRMAVVRLETAERLSTENEAYMCEKFAITPNQIFRTKAPMKLAYVFQMAEKVPVPMRRALIYEPFKPQPSAVIESGSMMRQIRRKDIMLLYPYENIEPFLRLIKEAAYDSSVMTIKITIYRLANKARLVEYLCAAAENGKEVTVLIELRARFDEESNINWSEHLEEAGCRIIYGFEGYKVHSKVCLITYRSRNEIQYITQIGTGNYNEKTAAAYTDISLMTADPEIGADASVFFKNMSIENLDGDYQHLLVAPLDLKQSVLREIDVEIEKGDKGRIIMKMNSLTDIDFIQKLAASSRAGVNTDLIVRGICCILPGIQGETENLTVTSIVGRYLEHARIFCFGEGEDQRVYIGSADMMTRNTEKRVEVACPVYSNDLKRRLNDILGVMLADNVKARRLTSEGSYEKIAEDDGGEPVNSQQVFMLEAMRAEPPKEKKKKTNFADKIKSLLHR